jgi:hypothetical protein
MANQHLLNRVSQLKTELKGTFFDMNPIVEDAFRLMKQHAESRCLICGGYRKVGVDGAAATKCGNCDGTGRRPC